MSVFIPLMINRYLNIRDMRELNLLLFLIRRVLFEKVKYIILSFSM